MKNGITPLTLLILFGLMTCLMLTAVLVSHMDAPSTAYFKGSMRNNLMTENSEIENEDVLVCDSGLTSYAILGDDYCDCLDGLDEVSTSACSDRLVGQKMFLCDDKGTVKIFTSRVNDYVCDCADGSDEYDTLVDCTKNRHRSMFHSNLINSLK